MKKTILMTILMHMFTSSAVFAGWLAGQFLDH